MSVFKTILISFVLVTLFWAALVWVFVEDVENCNTKFLKENCKWTLIVDNDRKIKTYWCDWKENADD